MNVKTCFFVVVAWLPASFCQAQKSPVLETLFPCACQRGQSITVKLTGKNLQSATELVFTQPGITAQRIRPGEFRITAKNSVSQRDCDVWVRLPKSLLGPRRFAIDDLPNAMERESNEIPSKANPLSMPGSVFGKLSQPTDIDWYSFSAARGQSLVIRCDTQRFDSDMRANLRIVAPDGSEVAHSRGHDMDTRLELAVQQTGTHRIRVQAHTLARTVHSFYRLTVMVAQRKFTPLLVPDKLVQGGIANRGSGLLNPGSLFLSGSRVSHSHSSDFFRIGITNKPLLIEQPDVDNKRAQKVTLPVHASGTLSRPNDVDWYEFPVKKGELLHVDAFGDRLGQKMDLELALHTVKGKLIQALPAYGTSAAKRSKSVKSIVPNLGITSSDVQGVWKATFSGVVRLAVRDLYGSSIWGQHRRYELVITRQPEFAVAAIHKMPAPGLGVAVRRGSRAQLNVFLHQLGTWRRPVSIAGVDGNSAGHLPSGMALTKVNLTSTKSARTILLHADAKTKPGIHFLSLQATSRLGKSKQKKRVHFAAQVRLGHTRLTDGIVVLVY